MIPYGRQSISAEDIDAAVEVLRSDFLTQGPCVPAFERALAERVGARYAVAVNSATSALHLACLALGVGPGDRVWTSPITFVATANCARYCGAEVSFVDIEPSTGNLCPQVLAARLQNAEREGALPQVIIAVHLAGQPCDMHAIHALAQRYGIKVIEDASHAVGGLYQQEPVGSGRYSDITVFSFHPVKVMTTGEGGAAVTNQEALAQTMSRLRSHGIDREPEQCRYPVDGPWYYEQQALGFNYRMTDIQAALGLSQLKRLDEFIAQRKGLAERYTSALADLPIQPLSQNSDRSSAWHLYVVRLPWVRSMQAKRDCVETLRQAGIGVQVHYIPVYRQPYYRERIQEGDGACPEAEAYYHEALSLPLFPGLTESEQDQVIGALHQVAENA